MTDNDKNTPPRAEHSRTQSCGRKRAWRYGPTRVFPLPIRAPRFSLQSFANAGLTGLALISLLLFRAAFVNAGHDEEYIDTIPPERVKKMLEGGEKILFVDLRPAGDFQKSRLPGARSIPITELQNRHQEIPKSGRVILYCACPPGGVDEAYSYLALRGKGYRNVSVLQDGFSGWAQRKFPTESR
jgi:rhodanese-related sulfurtransferase